GLRGRQRAELHHAVDQRLVARDLEEAAVLIKVGPTVPDVADKQIPASNVNHFGGTAHAGAAGILGGGGEHDAVRFDESGRDLFLVDSAVPRPGFVLLVSGQ